MANDDAYSFKKVEVPEGGAEKKGWVNFIIILYFS